MNKPILLIMAAGMGSRYGGLKQIDRISDQGEILLDFSLYDALMAGFEKVIFVIEEENEPAFRELLDQRAGQRMEICYAYQKLDDLPDGYAVPEGRVKPWGTAHAVMAARDLIDGPFVVINADDYYGPSAFMEIYDFLEKTADDDKYRCAMVGYQLRKTLTENGYVSRGVCEMDEAGNLVRVTERTRIQRSSGAEGYPEGTIVYTDDDGATWKELPEEATVSMNFWGFSKGVLQEMIDGFPAFLDKALSENPQKGEYFLPSIIQSLIDDGKATVRVLRSSDQWYGVTYKEDKPGVVAALQSMKDKGQYPDELWRSL